jgi:hypothetical protein
MLGVIDAIPGNNAVEFRFFLGLQTMIIRYSVVGGQSKESDFRTDSVRIIVNGYFEHNNHEGSKTSKSPKSPKTRVMFSTICLLVER